jgi:N-terminal acetyltransferase B complex non-catalytic subunit
MQSKATEGDWHITQRNVLKFSYLLTIALAPKHDGPSDPTAALEAVFASVIDFGRLRENKSSEGVIGIYTLLRMHQEVMRRDDETAPNSRLLLQSTMLARHLVACDKEKQDRPLALLAARLHLNLGLGQSAFKLYNHVKVKEMLVHTLSPYVLSRISVTHPFDVKGYGGFSAEGELEKALASMERMDRKIEDNLYADLQSFVWDQAIDLLQNKRNFRLSLTNHICITERRRIARLKGDYIDHVPFFDYKSKSSLCYIK